MNQNEQMREALQAIAKRAEELSFEPWDHGENFLFEELQKMAEDALAAEPAPLVRLTEDEVHKLIKEQHGKSVEGSNILPFTYADAIMDAMIAKNGGKS